MMTSGYNIMDLVREAQVRWLKPGEVLCILQNYEENQLTHEPAQKPPSGSMFLFNKRVLRFFRKDGHSWRRKKDGRTVGEAHERLKVGNVEALNCYYAHGELNQNFQRRSYWMLDPGMDHIVLVHYRDITMSGNSPGSIPTLSTGSSTLIQGSSSYASQFTLSAAAFSRFREPYDSTSSPSSIEVSSDVITKSNGTSPFSHTEGTEEISGPPNFEFDQALRRIEEQLSLDEDNLKELGLYSVNGISNESEFSANEQNYSGSGGVQEDLNSYASEQYSECLGGYVHQYQQQSGSEFSITSQQDSVWNDVLEHKVNARSDGSQKNIVYPSDRNGILLPQQRNDTVKEQERYSFGYTDANNNSSVLLPHEVEDFKFPAYTPARNLSESYPDFYSTLFDQGQSGMPLESDSRLTIAEEQKFTIREISPEWGYASEPTKVFVIGTFTRVQSKRGWYCMFGDTEVPIEIIQDGVLCCYSPPASLSGKVTLCITSGNRESCSEIREFEYRDKPNSYTNNITTQNKSVNSEQSLLLVRFVQMLLSDQLRKKEERVGNTSVDLLTSSMATEDSWTQVIEGLLDESLASFNATDWLMEELMKDKLQQWLSTRLQDKSNVSALSRREQGIIHMISGLGFGWALHPILKAGVGVNFRDINGWTALHWAARFGREKMVAELLASGASAGAVTDPSQQDPTGQTPASIAATCGHKGLAGYLSEVSLTSHPSSQLQQTELSRTSADIESERAAVDSISKLSLVSNEDLSLKDTLAAVRNVTQAAARIQSAFRAHSFRKRRQKESDAYGSGDEYGILLSDIEGLSAASKLTFRNGNDHNAALSIQKKYRGWKSRKDFLALRQKVVKIQAHVRGHQVRKSYRVFCWAVGVVEKVVLRWRRKGVGLRGFKQELGAMDENEDDDIVKAFRKEKVDVSIDESVSRVLSMVDSQPARQQYRRMLQKYRQAKAERESLESETASTSQSDTMNAENYTLNQFML
ncbi:calmodulin-binding transcription activator 4-like isoform X2 [Rutidosis leptorrhynchoides]|uniref:calmodulin-binding transcription activator 4-like isoform X2 n=1 Tax=Rutidosis leptorrhynchoides TaxID=125765 RepID=UPI003A98F648